MTISIQRGRQFAAGDASISLFDEKGAAGTYLQKAAEKLVTQQVTVTLQGGTLSTVDEWKKFIADNAGTKDKTAAFAGKFGITFQDFINVIDDAAASADTAFSLDLTPTSAVSKALHLDTGTDDYAAGLVKGATVDLGSATVTATAAGVVSIGPDILTNPVGDPWQRDRSEQESWADFSRGSGATSKFRENTGPAPFLKLTEPKWDDPEAMALVDAFALPLHLELRSTPNPDGTPNPQDGSEMFRDTYYDDRSGTISKSGASLRARVRFDDDEPFTVNRVLVQAKEGRVIGGDSSAVHKFEKRWEGTGTSEDAAKAMLLSGQETSTKPLSVSQKIYQLAKDKGVLPADGQLVLEPKFLVLQKRRRTHLQLDTTDKVTTRRDAAKAEADKLTAAGQPVPPALTAFIGKMDKQLELMTNADTLLGKYGENMPSGECFIVSADRYAVYDTTARKDQPVDLDDEVGRIGEGPLHVEAEWDTASSDPFENALDAIAEKLKANPADAAALEGDKNAIEALRETFRNDVAKTVDMLKQRLLGAGLNEDTAKKSKDERAADIAAGARPVFWL